MDVPGWTCTTIGAIPEFRDECSKRGAERCLWTGDNGWVASVVSLIILQGCGRGHGAWLVLNIMAMLTLTALIDGSGSDMQRYATYYPIPPLDLYILNLGCFDG